MPSAFYNARLLVDWKAQVATWPVTITNNGLSATCIMTPEKKRKTMQGNNYMDVVEVTVDMLRTDWIALSLQPSERTPRPRFKSSGGVTYESQAINDDENEPTVVITARRVQ